MTLVLHANLLTGMNDKKYVDTDHEEVCRGVSGHAPATRHGALLIYGHPGSYRMHVLYFLFFI